MRMIHEIDPARIEALGAPNPSDLREATLGCYRQVEQLYLDGDKLPSPDIEFVRRWVNRNAPVCEEGPAVITVDAGQFMFEGDELTGMVDLELVCIGDRHLDMAALRTRDLIEEIGDLESFYDLYHERGGLELDRDRIAFHYVTFAMLVPLQIAHELAHPELGPMHHEYFGWHARRHRSRDDGHRPHRRHFAGALRPAAADAGSVGPIAAVDGPGGRGHARLTTMRPTAVKTLAWR